MIEAKASGDKTYAKVAGTGRGTIKEYIMATKSLYETMVETGMLPEMAESLIHDTANNGIKMAKEEKC
jgi:hypothetical protein